MVGRKRKGLQDAENLIARKHLHLSSLSTASFRERLSHGETGQAAFENVSLERPCNRLKQPGRSIQRSSPQLEWKRNDPVSHWVCTFYWPKDFHVQGLGMAEAPGTKRRSSSLHRSEEKKRMAAHGIFFMGASRLMQRASQELC